MGVTSDLANFAAELTYDAIPNDVAYNAKLAIIDCVGTIFAGLQEESVRLVRSAALREAGPGDASIIGMGQKVSPAAAALANGSAAHALDFDNISLTVSGFIGSPTLFAILAVAQHHGRISGKRIVEAFVAGWEAESAIAAGLGVDHYARGWHSTATLGHFGAAVGAARVLGLDVDQIRNAIGIVASETSGLRTMVGNMTNPFHVGKAARNGVTAALLAADGFTGEPDVIEHPYGVAVAFNGKGNFDLAAMTSGLGLKWDLVDPGLVIKVYPCCGLIHSGIDAALLLLAQGLDPADIDSAELAVHALVPPTMKFDRPETGYEAKFSTPFCLATAFLEGAVKLEHFTDARTSEPALIDLMGRVSMTVHPELTDHSTFLVEEFSELRVTTKDGRRLVQRVARIANRGSKGNPADANLILAKFADCVGGHASGAKAFEAARAIVSLETVDDISAIMELLQ